MLKAERGQVLVMFAVVVPITIALLIFVVKVGRTYLEHDGARQTADSVMRTVEAILKDSAAIISEEDLPSSVETYSPTDEQIALKKLEEAIDFLKAETGADIEQKFMVDGDENIYYRVDVAQKYTAVFMLESENAGIEIESDPVALTAQLLAATAEVKVALINQLINPTPEQKLARLETLSGFLSNPVDSTDMSAADLEKNKSAVLLALLSVNTAFDDEEKGALFDAFLSHKLTDTQLQSANAINFKVIAINGAPNIDAREAADILYKALRVMPSVTALARKSVDSSIIITYEDSNATKRYHKVTVNDAAGGSNTVTNKGADTQFTV